MAVKYVRATGGSDANNGTTFALGWATLAYAFSGSNASRVAAGDTLAICADTGANAFVLTASVSPDYPGAPTYFNPVYLAGYSMAGLPLTNGSFAKITTASTLASGLFSLPTASNFLYTRFSNLLFDGGGSGKASYAISTNLQSNNGHVFNNCRFTNCSSHGIYGSWQNGVGYPWRFLQCEIDNNGKGGSGNGIASTSSARGNIYMRGCSIHNNAGYGVQFGDVGIFINNLIYKNSNDGIQNTQAGGQNITCIFEGNVFFGNTGDGLEVQSTAWIGSIVNNIFRSNGGYGIRTNGMDVDMLNMALMTNNCSHNNTSGHIDINGGVLPGLGNITSNPLFTSETAGSENFSLQSGSPCINAGYNPLGY